MEFEWDDGKSDQNAKKHGINFHEAAKVWESDPIRVGPIFVELDSGLIEDRYLVIGEIENVNWTVVTTYRGKRIRIISCRRSRREEAKLYGKSK